MGKKEITLPRYQDGTPKFPTGLTGDQAEIWAEIIFRIIDAGRLDSTDWDQALELLKLEIRRNELIDELHLREAGNFEPSTEWLDLLDPHEFDRRFNQHNGESRTQKEAYFKTEADYRQTFGENKYKSWDSYRSARWKRIRKRLGK